MAKQSVRRFFHTMYSSKKVGKTRELDRVYRVLGRCQSQWSKQNNIEVDARKEVSDAPLVSSGPKVKKMTASESGLDKYDLGNKDINNNKWNLELAWLTKALEPALELCRWALPTGIDKSPSRTRSVSEIIASIQRSKTGIESWSFSDMTVGLFLLYLRQASLNPFEDIKGVQITSESIVQDFIYHTELANGCYKNNTFGLAWNSMLRESNILKFEKNSSVMRPGYYIGIDPRKKLVILGIRGTHSVYDLITDIVSSSHEEVTFEGYSTHFGTAEAARWFLRHEMGTIKQCLEKHKGFRLRLVGHSLGGATAALLAIMLRKKSSKELGFSPEIVSAVGYATPPCVSRELAESCSNFVTTVVMQDDIIPRLSTASLARLRNEILQTDWTSVVEKEDWKNVIDFVTNAKQMVSSVQDVARKVADYANFRTMKGSSVGPIKKELLASNKISQPAKSMIENAAVNGKNGNVSKVPEELFVPGTVYYLERNIDGPPSGKEFFTLWRRHPEEHFQRIVLSNNSFSDHKCDSHFYALRDVLKGLPGTDDDAIFR